MIRDCGLLEFPYIGDCLSWRGWRDKQPIRCRLDRALASEDWHEMFSKSFTEYLSMVASDHKPILAVIENKVPKGRYNFRFDKCWIGKEGLMEAIHEGWHNGHETEPGNFVDKITNCRRFISRWRKNLVPYGRDLISDLKNQLENLQRDDKSSSEEIANLMVKLRTAYMDEELYWYQKSRNTWLGSADQNTKFFHAQVKQRRARNRIAGLHNAAGEWVTDEKKLNLWRYHILKIYSHPRIRKKWRIY